ncbi:hypothetical protein ABW19_dt0207122 [Dactylella cylindrospora]|nr:hypothetical protein ABW19_dt0207122 [Dactylella cylindrospora]
MQLKSLLLSSFLLISTVSASPMPVPTGGISNMGGWRSSGGPPKITNSNKDTTGTDTTGSGAPRKGFTNPNKGKDDKSKGGLSAWTKPSGMTKETLPQVLKAFEKYLDSQSLGPYTFLTAGGVYRVLNGLSTETSDIDIFSTNPEEVTAAMNAAREFATTTEGKQFGLGHDWFNPGLSAGMNYFDATKIWAAYKEAAGLVPLYKSDLSTITLFQLPLEWQIVTKMVRMDMWFRAGLTFEKNYIRELQHVLSLMWVLSDKGRDKVDVLNADKWLPGLRNAKSFGFSTGFLEALVSAFDKYVEVGGKFEGIADNLT